jgi:site-specific recombinase XerD
LFYTPRMTDPDAPDPAEPAAKPAAELPALLPAGPPALPPTDPAAPLPPGALILHTSLFGPLRVPDGAGHAAELEELSRRAAVYATRARGEGTHRAYRSAWRQYEAWCLSLGREPLSADPDTIAMYVVRCADSGAAGGDGLAGRGGLAVSSIRVHLAAIRTAHLLAGRSLDLRHPRLAMVIEGVTRSKGTRPQRQAAPAVPDVLRRMLAKLPAGGARLALDARDRAMLLLGFGAALRRSELVALCLGDVETVPGRGLRVLVRRSKTDQQGQGQEVAVWANPDQPGFCPLAALTCWMEHRRQAVDLGWTSPVASRAERPLFCAVTKAGRVTGDKLSDKAVARLVKQAALGAGLDPARYSGHSLRAGLAELMRQTRHKSTDVALGYLRPADLWRNNVTETVFRQEPSAATD